MDRIACVDCRQCNRKGKPSVTRFAKYCDDHFVKRIQIKKQFSFLTSFRNRIFDKRYDDKNNKMKTTKGFRPSWFWR